MRILLLLLIAAILLMPSSAMAGDEKMPALSFPRTSAFRIEDGFFQRLNQTLLNYNLIGLTADRVKEILGEPTPVSNFKLTSITKLDVAHELPECESLYYKVPSLGRFKALRIKLRRGEIVGWSIFCGGSESPTVNTNVILKLDPYKNPIYASEFGISYPETEPKVLEEIGRVEGPRDINLFNVEFGSSDMKVLTLEEYLNGEVGVFYGVEMLPVRDQLLHSNSIPNEYSAPPRGK